MSSWDSTDPFADARAGEGVLTVDFEGERIPLLLRYREVREAAADFGRFSSDAPFRVPIPDEAAFRDVRQLPIETDPPAHTRWRALVREFFAAPKRPDYIAGIERLCVDTVSRLPDSFEVVRELALPLQSKALARLLRMPDEHAEEWAAWGMHVFHGASADRARFEAYLERQFESAGTGDDFFSVLNRAEFDGRPLTRSEKLGFANLAFAGGRDTLLGVMSFAIAYFADHPDALDQLRHRPMLSRSATEEFVRIVSPLTHIGRVCPVATTVHGKEVPADHRVSLCWASANRDPAVFEHADDVQIERRHNPHLGFGSGPHICLGASHARLLIRSLISALAAQVSSIRVIDRLARYEDWPGYRRQTGFESLEVEIEARHPED